MLFPDRDDNRIARDMADALVQLRGDTLDQQARAVARRDLHRAKEEARRLHPRRHEYKPWPYDRLPERCEVCGLTEERHWPLLRRMGAAWARWWRGEVW